MEAFTSSSQEKDNGEHTLDQTCDNNLASYGSDVSGNTEGANLAQSSESTQPENMTSQSLMSRKHIEDALNQILDDVKNKRENDLHILSDVKKEIMNQATRVCQMLEVYMTHLHVTRSEQLDKQMLMLMSTLTKIQKLESELDKSKKSLSLLYEDIQGSSPFM
ncbi:unnamed protein product [Candidula unifasciata]|uniref:Synaptonemal complex central element protein 2 n=1 Tax=Candidula unifasciata TaxID=100452 RepID=A0A8S3YWK0_9EUPU|nr:unnamed protein product [Candidula unifasciata]